MVFLFTFFDFFPWFFRRIVKKKNEMDLSWQCYLNHSLRRQYIFSLLWSNLPFSWWKKKKKKRKKEKKKLKKSKKPKSMPVSFSGGIICGLYRGSFAVRDHLQYNLGIITGLGIICGRGSFAALYSTTHFICLCFSQATLFENPVNCFLLRSFLCRSCGS